MGDYKPLWRVMCVCIVLCCVAVCVWERERENDVQFIEGIQCIRNIFLLLLLLLLLKAMTNLYWLRMWKPVLTDVDLYTGHTALDVWCDRQKIPLWIKVSAGQETLQPFRWAMHLANQTIPDDPSTVTIRFQYLSTNEWGQLSFVITSVHRFVC